METTKRCPHCGATLPEGSIYCYKCGTKIETPADVLHIGDEVYVKIIEIDFNNKRVSLSMKDLLKDAE